MAELKHLSRPRKRDYSLSSGERTGSSPNHLRASGGGVIGATLTSSSKVRRKVLERPVEEGENPVADNR